MTLDYKNKILELQKKEAFYSGKIASLDALIDKRTEEYKEAKRSVDLYSECRALLTETSLSIQENTTEKIADIVTQLYRAVFGGTDEFVIKVDTKRKTPVADFYIKTKKAGKEVLLDPITSDGGGKMDVIALGLRIAALLLYKPALHRVLILDEPLRFISSSKTSEHPFRYKAVKFLKELSQAYGIQLIAVTHDSELVDLADTKFELSVSEDGYSVVTQSEE